VRRLDAGEAEIMSEVVVDGRRSRVLVSGGHRTADPVGA
jgi:hypothetical protein